MESGWESRVRSRLRRPGTSLSPLPCSEGLRQRKRWWWGVSFMAPPFPHNGVVGVVQTQPPCALALPGQRRIFPHRGLERWPSFPGLGRRKGKRGLKGDAGVGEVKQPRWIRLLPSHPLTAIIPHLSDIVHDPPLACVQGYHPQKVSFSAASTTASPSLPALP